MTEDLTPDLMPVLSRGKHRNPRKGACFMEMASYLAGERWSDHPECTHPLLAVLAREVNDRVGDAARQRLAPLIPEVIGLNGDDPRIDAWIALDAARAALPVASAERQGVCAVGVLRCERVLNALEGRPTGDLSAASRRVLRGAPHAERWAREFTRVGWGKAGTFRRRSGPSILHSAVVGIAEACIEDPDSVLVDLLEGTIEKCNNWLTIVTDEAIGVPVTYVNG